MAENQHPYLTLIIGSAHLSNPPITQEKQEIQQSPVTIAITNGRLEKLRFINLILQEAEAYIDEPSMRHIGTYRFNLNKLIDAGGTISQILDNLLKGNDVMFRWSSEVTPTANKEIQITAKAADADETSPLAYLDSSELEKLLELTLATNNKRLKPGEDDVYKVINAISSGGEVIFRNYSSMENKVNPPETKSPVTLNNPLLRIAGMAIAALGRGLARSC